MISSVPIVWELGQVHCHELLDPESLKTLLFLLQIYVDEVPLPFPGHTLIAIATAVVMGGLIFIVFMLQIRNIHPLDKFKQFLRRNKMNLSNTSVSQQAHQ